MPPEKAPETSEEIFEQIRNADIGDESQEEISEETEEQEEEMAEESSEDEEKTESEEETETAEEEKEQEPQLYPINVDGNIEMVTQEQLIQYAQKGRFLEKERAKDKAEKGVPEFDSKKADELFYANVKNKGFVGAMVDLLTQGNQMLTAQQREMRKATRVIADSSEWGKDQTYRAMFDVLVDEGMEPERAGAEISAKYWEGIAHKGQEIGAEKERKKEGAKIPAGKENAPDTRESGTEASVMEGFEALMAKKTPTKDLLAYMRKHGVPVGRDDLIS